MLIGTALIGTGLNGTALIGTSIFWWCGRHSGYSRTIDGLNRRLNRRGSMTHHRSLRDRLCNWCRLSDLRRCLVNYLSILLCGNTLIEVQQVSSRTFQSDLGSLELQHRLRVRQFRVSQSLLSIQKLIQ